VKISLQRNEQLFINIIIDIPYWSIYFIK
jgi:hypothetical protein